MASMNTTDNVSLRRDERQRPELDRAHNTTHAGEPHLERQDEFVAHSRREESAIGIPHNDKNTDRKDSDRKDADRKDSDRSDINMRKDSDRSDINLRKDADRCDRNRSDINSSAIDPAKYSATLLNSNPALVASPSRQDQSRTDPSERWLGKQHAFDGADDKAWDAERKYVESESQPAQGSRGSNTAAAAEGSKKDKRKSWTSIDDKNHPDYKSASSIPQQPEHLPNAPWADPKQFEREVKEHRHDDLKGIKELSPREQKADAEDPAERWLEKNKPEGDSGADRKQKRKSWTSIDDKNHPDYKLAASIPKQPEHLPNAPWADPKQFEREVKEHRHDDLKGIKELSPREQKADAADPAERWLEKNKPEGSQCCDKAAGQACCDSKAAGMQAKGNQFQGQQQQFQAKGEQFRGQQQQQQQFQRDAKDDKFGKGSERKEEPIDFKSMRHDQRSGLSDISSPVKMSAERVDASEQWLEKNQANIQPQKHVDGGLDAFASSNPDIKKFDEGATIKLGDKQQQQKQQQQMSDKWTDFSGAGTPPMQHRGDAMVGK